MGRKKNLYRPTAIPCACGCGRKTDVGKYAYWHVKNPDLKLARICECGCGGTTSGKADIRTREPVARIWRHNAKTHKNRSAKLCACGCGRFVSSKRDEWIYASWHTKHDSSVTATFCICGCGEKTSGRIRPDTGQLQRYVAGHHSFGDACKWGRGRKFRTNIEKLTEEVIQGLNLAYEFEYPLFFFHIDFAFPKIKAALEVDGEYWHLRRGDGSSDRRKETYLKNHGWSLVRLPEKEIINNAKKAVTAALQQLGVLSN